jgi:hypothetical protein
MHDESVQAVRVLGVHLARVGEVGFLFDTECVELGAEQNCGAGGVGQDADDAGAADGGGDFVAEGAQAGCERGGGLGFVAGELGVGAEVEVELFGGEVGGVDLGGEVVGAVGGARKDRENAAERMSGRFMPRTPEAFLCSARECTC